MCVEKEVDEEEERAGTHEEEGGHPVEHSEGLQTTPQWDVDGCKLWPVLNAQVQDTAEGTQHPWQSVQGKGMYGGKKVC